jgi:isopentenyl-diphosphate delta-isomerase type 1
MPIILLREPWCCRETVGDVSQDDWTMNELLIQVDDQDNVIGAVERLKAHLDHGILHRGLVVIVMNDENKILLTQRSMERPDLSFPPPFPAFWDITLAGHPKWGQTDYVTQMASEVQEELGISAKKREFEYVGKFQYYAPDPTYPNPTAPTFKLSEREICGVGVLHTNGNPILNSTELQASMWVESKRLADKIKSLRVAPWASLMREKFPQVWLG